MDNAMHWTRGSKTQAPQNRKTNMRLIQFNSAASLALFLAVFIPNSSATYKVREDNNGIFTLTFDGGY